MTVDVKNTVMDGALITGVNVYNGETVNQTNLISAAAISGAHNMFVRNISRSNIPKYFNTNSTKMNNALSDAVSYGACIYAVDNLYNKKIFNMNGMLVKIGVLVGSHYLLDN